MFIGEMCCLVAYIISVFVQRHIWRKKHPGVSPTSLMSSSTLDNVDGKQNNGDISAANRISDWPKFHRMNYFLFAAPAFCDVCGTSIQYLGLGLTSAASFQMLRGERLQFFFALLLIFSPMRAKKEKRCELVSKT